MSNCNNLKDCYDATGNFVPTIYTKYANQRDENLEEAEAIPEDLPKKRPYMDRSFSVAVSAWSTSPFAT